ncbi:hypothetical protein K525DRAFT_253394 [Schizophyllum commune Loenen D]|nr:hypothetical protein K525DRAFT_253394 [Schizophyllum commune Loenen D]
MACTDRPTGLHNFNTCWATLRGPRIARQKASDIEWAKDMVQSTKTAELRLERERNRLLNCLREVNEDGARPNSWSSTWRPNVLPLTEDEYALAKRPRGRLKASKTKKRHTQRAGESPRARRGSFGFVDIVRPRLFATAVGEHDAMCDLSIQSSI